MKRATRKVSGPQMERFFRHYFAQEPGLESLVAEALTRRSVATFSSVQVRKDVVPGTRPAGAVVRRPLARTQAAEAAAPTVSQAESAAFDPYAVGLVPTFQREGRDGLLAKLAPIGDIAHLRQMARSQQISLPAELRTGDADATVLRGAIVDAVEKRIADRRAAAGDKG